MYYEYIIFIKSIIPKKKEKKNKNSVQIKKIQALLTRRYNLIWICEFKMKKKKLNWYWEFRRTQFWSRWVWILFMCRKFDVIWNGWWEECYTCFFGVLLSHFLRYQSVYQFVQQTSFSSLMVYLPKLVSLRQPVKLKHNATLIVSNRITKAELFGNFSCTQSIKGVCRAVTKFHWQNVPFTWLNHLCLMNSEID